MVSGLSLLCTGLVLNVYMKSPVTTMSWCTRTLIFDIIGRLVCHSCSPNGRENAKNKRQLSAGLHDFIYMQNGDISGNMANNEIITMPDYDVRLASPNRGIASLMQHRGVTVASNNCHVDNTDMVSKYSSLNYDILREIRKITAKMESDAEEEKLKFVWNEAAKILDRFCLFIFVMLNAVAIVILLGDVYEWW